MFQVTAFDPQTAHYRIVAEFPTYREARRVVRRSLLRYWSGLIDRLEVTQISERCYATLSQPSMCNYGRVDCNEEGYQERFTPTETINDRRKLITTYRDRSNEVVPVPGV